jgi:hypothetical protein
MSRPIFSPAQRSVQDDDENWDLGPHELFYGDGLGQITGLIHIAATQDGDVIGQ